MDPEVAYRCQSGRQVLRDVRTRILGAAGLDQRNKSLAIGTFVGSRLLQGAMVWPSFAANS
eukprot:10165850-Lingulodinium_polyedra.AAC.1